MNTLIPAMLFVPGGDQRKLAKLAQLAAPALILDLEDAVADSAKPAARCHVADTLANSRSKVPLWVRVNRSHSELLYDDLDAVIQPSLTGVVLPKIRTGRDVRMVDDLLNYLERRAGLESRIQLMPTIESVDGLAAVAEIASASPRIRCLAFGAGDFCLDVGLEWPPPDGELSPLVVGAKCQLVLASRNARLQPPHDGVYPLFRDHHALRAETLQSRGLGMFGKHAVHPDQIPFIVDIFRPSDEELARARRLVAAFDASEAGGVANLNLNGHFVDYPVAAHARQLLQLAADLEEEVR